MRVTFQQPAVLSARRPAGWRLGLCCVFVSAPIRFRVTTAAMLARLPRRQRLQRLSDLCLANAHALAEALQFCSVHGIGAFRINSRILPLKTHPVMGYEIAALPKADEILAAFKACGQWRARHQLRLLFHPDQFIVLGAPDEVVAQSALRELVYQAEVASWVGADVVNLHAGGLYGDKTATLARLARRIERLPASVRRLLTLENDDRCYAPSDLLPLCQQTGVPLVYDVHHHRCRPDGCSVEDVTEAALRTWNREPVFHLSSPREGWQGPNPRPHADYIDPDDIPACWRGRSVTVEIEAKAKELALERLRHDLEALAPAAAPSHKISMQSPKL